MFKLVIQDDEGKTTVVPLVRDEITIGRKEGNTIRLTERNVSRKHARISRANGAVAIEDLGSYNGVRVNGTRISQRTVLSVSDRVQIGDYLIELKAEGVEQPVPYEDARTQPIERIDPAQLAAVMPQPMQSAAPMSLADTDPTARAATSMPMAQVAAAPGGHPRLVVLSSNFAGREFQLTKQQMVIGRTDDNDIVINHRSISRNHAKVIREADSGRYTIMDLQSSNGVRVNGEDYGKVELRRGDTVDLGHVRFRFVDAGEDFVFGRDAQIVDVPTKKSKGWLFALIGLVVIGGVVAVVASSGGGGSKKEASAVAAGTGSEVGATGSNDPVVDPTGSGKAPAVVDIDAGGGSAAVAVQPPSGKPEVEKFLGEARAAIADSKWADASDAANAALKLEPDNTEASTLAKQAKTELGNHNTYTDFAQAAARRQYETAISKFEEIQNDSVYKNKARDQYDQLHTQYVAEVKRDGAALARAKKCAQLKRLAVDAKKVFSDAGAAVEAIPCDEQVAVKPGNGSGSNTGSNTAPPDRPPPPVTGDAPAMLAEAREAAKSSQWGKALSKAEDIMRMSSADGSAKAGAVMVAVLAACNLKSNAKAQKYYNIANPSQKQMLRQRCLAVAGFDPGQ